MIGFIFLSCGLALAYVAIMATYLYGWRSLPVWQVPPDFIPRTAVTVIIPARNEAGQIGDCLSSIIGNVYPKQLLEILVADDHSTDNTGQIVLQIAAKQEINIRLIDLATFSGPVDLDFSGKKKALETAISQARGELIVTTDADCLTPPNWILSLASAYESACPKAIAGPVVFRPGRNVLQHFQVLDFVGLMGITGAGIRLGWQHIGNGANLAYPKTVFEAVGGFSGNKEKASGDDLFLLQKIARRWPGQVFFLKNADAAVLSDAEPDWRAFLQQRLRWGTKNAGLPETPVKAVLALVFLFCWSILISATLSFFYPCLLWLLTIQLGAKALSDYLLLRNMCIFFKIRSVLHWFWPSFFLHTVYIAAIGTASLFVKKYTWKGRRVE